MRTEFSNVQETRPLLDTQKTTTTTKSENNSIISKKFLLSVIFLLIVAIIIFALVLNQTGNVPRNKEFVFSDEWSSLETIDTKYIPKRWTFDSLCGDDESIELTFAVKQQNVDLIHDKIYEVSNPKSSTFGQHWTMEEIHEFLKPKDDSIDMLISWFEYYNIDTNNINYLTLNKDFIRIETTIKIANEMLNTQYAYWVNEDGDKHIRVKEGYYVPSTISEHLDFVSPTLRFPPRRHTKTVEKIDVNAISSSSITYNTPSRIRSLYQMDDYINLAAYPGHFQAIATFLGEWFTDSDIELFWEFFEIDSADLTRVPSFQPTGYGDECDLDIEYITTTGSRIDTYIWDIEDDLYFISLIQQMLESGSPPSVVSMSYGGDEQSNGFVYCHRANVEFAKIGLYGTTVLASSGDSGVTGDSYQCTDEYYPSFPASSPYVIAVGGTTGGDISSSLDLSTGETAWVDSGGGFSWFFQRQSWQDDAIETYYSTATSLPSSTKFNGYGRGYPDLSAQSVDYIICMESEFWSVSGTSCSCPTVAGMISLVNDVRLQKGKSRLGWILPSLYSLLSEDSESYYFNDVTEGYNVGCEDDNYVAFSAASYWDPVTGFGTIKYPRLFDALVDL